MIKAFLKLAAIGISVILLSFLIVFGVRLLGSQQTFAQPHHAWMARPFWWIYRPSAEALCQTADVDTLIPSPDWIVVLPVVRNDQEWIVPCKNPKTVHDFLQTKHVDWLLDVKAHDTWNLDDLITAVNSTLPNKNIGAWADSQKVSLYLRKKSPEWLFAADTAALVRFRMYISLWIESAIDFWPDFVIASFAPSGPFRFDIRGSGELARRKKRIVWEWNDESQQPEVPIQGIMTNRPSAAQQKFGGRL